MISRVKQRLDTLAITRSVESIVREKLSKSTEGVSRSEFLVAMRNNGKGNKEELFIDCVLNSMKKSGEIIEYPIKGYYIFSGLRGVIHKKI